MGRESANRESVKKKEVIESEIVKLNQQSAV